MSAYTSVNLSMSGPLGRNIVRKGEKVTYQH